MPNQDLDTLGAEMQRLTTQFEELGRRMTLLEERVMLLARLTRARSDQPQTIAIPHLPDASRRWLGLGKQQTEVSVEQALTSLAMGLPLIADHWLLANARLKALEDRLAAVPQAPVPGPAASTPAPSPAPSTPEPSTPEPAMDDILANIRKVVAFDAPAPAKRAAAPPPQSPPPAATPEPALSELPREERLLRVLRGLGLPDERGRLVLELAVQRQPRAENEFLTSCFEAIEFLEPEVFRHQRAQGTLGDLAASLLGPDTKLVWPQPGRPAAEFALEGATSGVIAELLVPGFEYTDAQGQRVTMKARARTEPG